MCTRIAIIDERPIFRIRVAHVLGAEVDVHVAAQGVSAKDALALVRDQNIDLLVLGLHEALDSLKALREKGEEVAVLVVADDPHGDLARPKPCAWVRAVYWTSRPRPRRSSRQCAPSSLAGVRSARSWRTCSSMRGYR